MKDVTASSVASFVIAFIGTVALWWLYFDRSAGLALLALAADAISALALAACAAVVVTAVAVSDRLPITSRS